MFTWFAQQLPNGAADLFALHPSDLVALMEYAWTAPSTWRLRIECKRDWVRDELP